MIVLMLSLFLKFPSKVMDLLLKLCVSSTRATQRLQCKELSKKRCSALYKLIMAFVFHSAHLAQDDLIYKAEADLLLSRRPKTQYF